MLPHPDRPSGGLDLEDHAQVHGAHRVRIVIQQAAQLERGLPAGIELFGPLAPQTGEQRIVAGVDRVEVPADPDAGLAMQPRVTAAGRALHEEDPIALAHDDVRNQLLQLLVVLGGGPIDVPAVLRHGDLQLDEVGIGRMAHAAEITPARHTVPGQHQNLFGHASSLAKRCKVPCKAARVTSQFRPGPYATATHHTEPLTELGAGLQRSVVAPMVMARNPYYGTGRNRRFSRSCRGPIAALTDLRLLQFMVDPLPNSSPSSPRRYLSLPFRRRPHRGQSLVEFALVLPMLLVLLLGIADFGRVFSAGIILEAAARNGAEVAAQEYLQVRRSSTAPTSADYDRIRDAALVAVCREAERLPDRTAAGGMCSMPATAVCIHDDATELPGYAGCGTGSSIPPECTGMTGWTAGNAGGRLPNVEVRVCYRFTTLFNLEGLSLPLANGLNLGTIWLEKDRSFAVADY